MARGRGRPDQVLAFDAARRHTDRNARRYRQTPMAHRARLPGPEAGDRPRPLRGSRLARIPSPRGALDRGLRIPRRREESNSPLRRPPPSAHRKSADAERKLPSARTRRSGLSATHPIRSRPCESSSPSRLPSGCRDVHAACERAMAREHVVYDTVRLVDSCFSRSATRRGAPRDQCIASTFRVRAQVGRTRVSSVVCACSAARCSVRDQVIDQVTPCGLPALQCYPPFPGSAQAPHKTREQDRGRQDQGWHRRCHRNAGR